MESKGLVKIFQRLLWVAQYLVDGADILKCDRLAKAIVYCPHERKHLQVHVQRALIVTEGAVGDTEVGQDLSFTATVS